MNLFRLGLQPRLYSGFGVLVLLGLLLAGFAAWQLTTIETQVGKMTALNDNVTRALEVAEQLQIQRRTALRYTVEADEDSVKEHSVSTAKSIEVLHAAAKATLSEERRKTYNGIEAGIGALKVKMETLVGLGKQIQADRAKLFSVGDEMATATARLVEAGRANTGAERTLAAGAVNIETDVLLVRIAN